MNKWLSDKLWIVLTHIECDSDNVEAHSGVCYTTEGWGLWREHSNHSRTDTLTLKYTCVLSLNHWDQGYVLTLSIFVTFCLRRRRLCLRMRCEEELRSVELLNLWHRDRGQSGDSLSTVCHASLIKRDAKD